MIQTTRKKYVRCNAEQKRFIVESLAAYCPPSEVARALKQRDGFQMSPQAIECYDPTKRAGRGLSEEWREVFDRARMKYIEQIGNIGIAHRVYRLEKLDEAVHELRERGAYMQMMKLLEIAAKEMGGYYHK